MPRGREHRAPPGSDRGRRAAPVACATPPAGPGAVIRGASTMSDPEVLLRAVRDGLAAVEPQARVIRPKGPDRRRLADAVGAATGHAAAGAEAGCEAAIADLAGAREVVDRFRDDPDHPNARVVARAAGAALEALEAIDWRVAPRPT